MRQTMNILKSYTEGFKKTSGIVRVVTIIYGITLLLGLILALTFNSVLTKDLNHRSELYNLFHDFNFTVYSDFMNNYGDIVRPLISIMIWFGFFYFVFTVFFSGGILKLFEGSSIKSKAQAFFAGSAKFFFRFLRLGIYILVFQGIVFAVIAIGFSSIFNRALPVSTEPQLFTIIVVWAAVHFIFFIFISIVSDYAKIILVKEDSKKVWRAIRSSFKFTVKKLYITFPLYIILLIAPALLFLVYFRLEEFIGMTSSAGILIMFIVQQVFIWSRLFSKVWILGSGYDLFSSHLLFRSKPLITQEILLDESL